MAKKNSVHDSQVDYKEMLAMYDELGRLKEEHPDIVAEVTPRLAKRTFFEYCLDLFQRIQERYHLESPVNKNIYCKLCLLGVFGVHHFYSRHWMKGLIYLLISWTGITVAFAFIDWMAAFPKQADEKGMILI